MKSQLIHSISGAELTFKLKIRNFEGYRNYDKSEFEAPSELFDGDEGKLESVYSSLYGLNEFVNESNYKSYSELKKKLYEVLGEEDLANTFSTEKQVELNETLPPKIDAPVASQMEDVDVSLDSEDDGDTLDYFAKLAQQG